MRTSLWIGLAATMTFGAVLAATPAAAQGAGGFGANSGLPSTPKSKPAAPPPDALPGAHADRDRVTPAERSTADMQPTDALFDAINRGDITTARDAISRGADLQGHNLLGMTPLELSVDLGRNDITFLILSYRGIDGALPSHGAAPGQATAAPAPRMTRAEQRRAAQEAAAQARAARIAAEREAAERMAAARAASQPPAQPATPPRSYASDGGAPVPSAGFLGYGR